MKKTLHQKVVVAANKPLELEYFLLKNEMDFEGGKITVYGIEVSKNHEEIKSIIDISSDKNKAQEILHTLAENTVTPISLIDVLEDII